MMDSDLGGKFLSEPGISDTSKIQNFLLVSLGIRKASLTYLPAELPGGPEMGLAIDRYYYAHIKPGTGRHPPSMEHKLSVMAAAYEEVVHRSPEYQAHLRWAGRLGLSVLEVHRRPTLVEMFLYADDGTRTELLRLRERAEDLRRVALSGLRTADRPLGDPLIARVYPDELDAKYLRRLAGLLGYPACCTERYLEDRLSGHSVELRASEQILQAASAGRPVDVQAYYLKDFFPCSPDCPEATLRARQITDRLSAESPAFRDLYFASLTENHRLVRDYPKILAEHKRHIGSHQM